MKLKFDFDTYPWPPRRGECICRGGAELFGREFSFDYTQAKFYTGKPPWRRLKVNHTTVFEVNADLSGWPCGAGDRWSRFTLDVFGRRIVGR